MSALSLYTYFRSSAAYRVRIVLNLKGLDYDPHFIHLAREGGENWRPEYLAIAATGLLTFALAAVLRGWSVPFLQRMRPARVTS